MRIRWKSLTGFSDGPAGRGGRGGGGGDGGRGGLIAAKIRFTIVNFIAVIFPNYNKNG